jgi:hypothetical protein
MHDRLLIRIGALALIALIAGCGGASLESVAGKVTLDGSPLPDVYMTLAPKDASASERYAAKTDASGSFSFGAADNPGGGVPAGAYSLSMTTAFDPNADEMTPAPREKVPAPYSTGGADFEVPAGGTDAANFDLKSK